jgi:uncharacterized protein
MSQVEYEFVRMQINVAQLLKEPVGACRTYEIYEPASGKAADSIKGEVNLTRTSQGVLVTGSLSTTIYGTCDRCLKDTATAIKFTLEDEYLTRTDVRGRVHFEVEPDEFTISDDHIIDLSEAIRQYIIMSTPVKMLCSVSCPGICQVCGHDLASGDCGHSDEKTKTRWAKLIEI